jgi:DNA-binding PadR family transcriptional regulator
MMASPDDPARSIPLRPVELQILLVLAEGEAHGYHVIRRTRERTEGAVDLLPGTLYRALQRLEAQGWVRRTEGPLEVELEDPRRRYYALTEPGRQVVAAELRRLEGLVRVGRELDLLGPETV